MSERINNKNVETKTITSTDQKYNNNNNNNNNQSSTKRSSFFSSSSNKNNRKTAQMTQQQQQQQPSQSGCWFGIFATGKNLFCEVNMSGDKPNLADLAQQEPSGGKFIMFIRERERRDRS
jgi:hypothetical protein